MRLVSIRGGGGLSKQCPPHSAQQVKYHGLGEGSNEGEEQAVTPPVPRERRAHHVAGVQGQYSHPLSAQLGAQCVREENVAQLGMIVGPHVAELAGRGRQSVQVHCLFCET